MFVYAKIAAAALVVALISYLWVSNGSLSAALDIKSAKLAQEIFEHEITAARLATARETAVKQIEQITNLTAANVKGRREIIGMSARLDELRTEADEHPASETPSPTESDPNVPLPAQAPSFSESLNRLARDANRLLERNGAPQN